MELILQFNTEGMTSQQVDTLIRRVTDIADESAFELGGELVSDYVDWGDGGEHWLPRDVEDD